MDALLEGLNDAQKTAVTSPANVVQVLAPPGSGKTKTLTARVAYHVIHERLQPWNIIVCTFTIKAAREMKERIKGFVGDNLESKLILGTFHSVARRFLSRYGQEIGIDKNFGIADTSDTTAILKRLITRFDYTVEPGHARSRISKLKAQGITSEDFRSTTKNVNDNEFAQVYSSYQEHLQVSNLLDYDDLLMRCVELLKRCPSCVSTIQAVLIDEYQDTNNIQYELMKLLAQSARRVTIVGDPDQSIYSFRSAEIKNLLRMREEFPESVVINLENNYRSSACILGSALAVIEQDESRPQKALLATHGVGEMPTFRHLASPFVEASWIVEEISRIKTLSAGLLSFNDFAILVRSSNLSLQIERAFGQAGVPYRMVAGTKFFDRAEIKIILDYLRVVNQPDNNDAVARVINVPARKVGDVTVKALLEESEVRKVTLWKLILDMAQGRKRPNCKVSAQAQKGIEQFVDVILSSRKKIHPQQGDNGGLFELISHILQKISFEAYLKQTHKDNWQDRWTNVEELVAQATQLASDVASGEGFSDDALPTVDGLEQRLDTPADILSKFLANVTLSSVADQDGGDVDQVTISTIHAAKGLEWPVVFLPAVYNGSIPHSRADDFDEERRLLYVGMTRAQGLLYLSCPVKQSGQEQTTISRYVSDTKIQRLFSARGPDLAFKSTTIPDLARILRRACPLATDIETARCQLERLEDDKYPGTREEIDDASSNWGSTFDRKTESRFRATDMQPALKRRRTEEAESGVVRSSTSYSNDASEYSIAATSMHSMKGFTSARDLGDLQTMQQEAERIRTLATAPTAAAGRAVYQKSLKAEPTSARVKPAKPRATGQGAITTFFRKTGDSMPERTAPSYLREAEGNSARSASAPLKDVSNFPPNIDLSARVLTSTSTISYKALDRPMTTKPRRIEADDTWEDTKYVLLSSSPVKADNETSECESKRLEPATDRGSTNFNSRPTTISGFRPASTCHNTSVSQVQQFSANRKTLGARRTMQGWSVKHTSMPKPRPP